MVTGNMCGVYGCTDKSEGVAKVIYERGEEIVPACKKHMNKIHNSRDR